MAEITVETGLLDGKVVDKNIHVFGEAGPKDIIQFEFNYYGSESSIEYIETSCSCTKAWYHDGKIKGTLDLAKVQKEAYPKGQTSIGKNIIVMVNDGVSRFVANDKKQKITHPGKKWFRLLVTGLVVV